MALLQTTLREMCEAAPLDAHAIVHRSFDRLPGRSPKRVSRKNPVVGQMIALCAFDDVDREIVFARGAPVVYGAPTVFSGREAS